VNDNCSIIIQGSLVTVHGEILKFSQQQVAVLEENCAKVSALLCSCW